MSRLVFLRILRFPYRQTTLKRSSLAVPDQAGGLFWALLCRIFTRKHGPKDAAAAQASGLISVSSLVTIPLFAVLIILILLPAELHIPTKRLQQLYADNLPIISPLHGLGMLGVVQCWIAAVVLGKYVGRFEQVTGWIGFIIGCLNCLAVSHCHLDPRPPTHS